MKTSNLKEQITKVLDANVSDEVMAKAIKKCLYDYERSVRDEAEKLVSNVFPNLV